MTIMPQHIGGLYLSAIIILSLGVVPKDIEMGIGHVQQIVYQYVLVPRD